jgi:hypothetical protein
MKLITAAEPLEIAKHDEQGRRIAGVAEKKALIASWESSGMTQKAFARREGINYHTFATWLRTKRLKAEKEVKMPRFLEVGLRPASGFRLEAAFPDGLVIRGISSAEVAALARALR